MSVIENIRELLNSNFLIAFITFLVGFVAFWVYKRQQADAKRDAAKIILQEIRRAEDVIADYKEYGKYQFTRKIIATNSWAKNVHFFVGDLAQDELDRISNLYSTGEYLDDVIKKISDFKFDSGVEEFKQRVQQQVQGLQRVLARPSHVVDQVTVQGSTPAQKSEKIAQEVQFSINLETPWKGLLDKITLRYEPVYHSEIGAKLKRIAEIK